MEKHQEEIDIFYLYKVLVDWFKRIIKFGFDILNFIKKSWIILLVLILAGVGYGYYIFTEAGIGQESKILVRINFDAVNYVYSKVNFLNEKIAEKEEGKFKDESVPKALAKLTDITIEPVINLNDIIEDVEPNEPTVEGLLRYLEFEFDEDGEITSIADTFKSEYNYHYLEIHTNSFAKSDIIEKLMAYLNDNEQLQEFKNVYVQTLKDAIQKNRKTIDQIDQVIAIYNEGGSLPSPRSEIFVVDKNFNIAQLLTNKVDLEKEIEVYKKELVISKDLVVNINQPSLYIGERSLLDNKMVYYPALYVFIFFLLAGIRGLYFTLKRFAEN